MEDMRAHQAQMQEAPEGAQDEPEGSKSRKRRRDESMGPWEFTPDTDVAHESGCPTREEYKAHRGRAASRHDRDLEAAEMQRENWRRFTHSYDLGVQTGRAMQATDMEVARLRYEHQISLTREAEVREVAVRRALRAAEQRADALEKEVARLRVELTVQKAPEPEAPLVTTPLHQTWPISRAGFVSPAGAPANLPGKDGTRDPTLEEYERAIWGADGGSDYSPPGPPTPPEVTGIKAMALRAYNSPGGEDNKSIVILYQEVKKWAPHLRTDVQRWLVDEWKPRDHMADARRARRIERKQEEVARELLRVRLGHDAREQAGSVTYRSQAGSSRPEPYGAGIHQMTVLPTVARGRGMARGCGRGEAPRGAPTGRVAQPAPTAPIEAQMEFYRQHPQGMPPWILVRYATAPKVDYLRDDETNALRAYLFLRRIAPLTAAERQSYMRLAEQILSQTGTYEEWLPAPTRPHAPNEVGELERPWAGLPTLDISEAALQIHLAQQGITQERFTALHTWATWAKAGRVVVPTRMTEIQRAGPQGNALQMDLGP